MVVGVACWVEGLAIEGGELVAKGGCVEKGAAGDVAEGECAEDVWERWRAHGSVVTFL